MIFIYILIIFTLFIILGISADVTVNNIKKIASTLKLKLFTFGIILGIITTLPEIFLGINATFDNIASVSVGNLLGGIIILFGLVLGLILILNNKIKTDDRFDLILPQLLVIFSPILLGLDGVYNLLDGLIMVGLYVGLILYLYKSNKSLEKIPNEKILFHKTHLTKAIIFSILGISTILISSHWIIEYTLKILNSVKVEQILLGTIIFAIGTNLPEITIAFTSWLKKSSELSLSHILSSAFTNIFVLGILSIIKPIFFTINTHFLLLILFLTIFLILFLIFYHSEKKLDRKEGVIFVVTYIIFLIVTLYSGK